MRKYELIVMFNPRVTEDKVKSEVDSIVELLKANGATQVVPQSWGRLKLAYQLRKVDEAHYRGIYFSADSAALVDTITHKLRITESIVKFQTHRINEKVRKVKERRNSRPSEEDDDIRDTASY